LESSKMRFIFVRENQINKFNGRRPCENIILIP
jgi:hypothetical protein